MRKHGYPQSMAIDNLTGYDDLMVCECRPCKCCDGEGVHVIYEHIQNGVTVQLPNGLEVKCDKCVDGQDTSDCEIHGE
jgi:hypothetical protein